jgi:hypothetical protein
MSDTSASENFHSGLIKNCSLTRLFETNLSAEAKLRAPKAAVGITAALSMATNIINTCDN